jgi:hypothetical protein
MTVNRTREVCFLPQDIRVALSLAAEHRLLDLPLSFRTLHGRDMYVMEFRHLNSRREMCAQSA